jgi:hypothetical protein
VSTVTIRRSYAGEETPALLTLVALTLAGSPVSLSPALPQNFDETDPDTWVFEFDGTPGATYEFTYRITWDDDTTEDKNGTVFSPYTPASGAEQRAERWSVIVAPTTRPVLWADAKKHLRLDSDDDQTYVEMLIDAAADYAEHAMQKSLVPRTILATFYEGDELRLPRSPLIEVLGVTNADGDAVTDYTIEHWGMTPFIVSTATRPLSVTYRAGYTGVIPAGDRIAILTHVGTMYACRDSVSDKEKSPVPHLMEAFYRQRRRSAGVR